MIYSPIQKNAVAKYSLFDCQRSGSDGALYIMMYIQGKSIVSSEHNITLLDKTLRLETN